MRARNPIVALLVAATLGMGLAACANKANISPAVAKINVLAAAQRVRFECPKEVDSKIGTRFTCDLVGPTGKRKPIAMKVSKKDTIDVFDAATLSQTIRDVQ
jgi:hypothetical protein